MSPASSSSIEIKLELFSNGGMPTRFMTEVGNAWTIVMRKKEAGRKAANRILEDGLGILGTRSFAC